MHGKLTRAVLASVILVVKKLITKGYGTSPNQHAKFIPAWYIYKVADTYLRLGVYQFQYEC